jgi:lipopolysaccharide biosynthesis regulator YciM
MPLVIQASHDQKYPKERGRHIDLNILHSKTTTTIGSIAESSTSQILSLRRPVRSRVDYNLFNYCSTCNVKLPKQTVRCPDCKQQVRTKPWHRSKIIQLKRI